MGRPPAVQAVEQGQRRSSGQGAAQRCDVQHSAPRRRGGRRCGGRKRRDGARRRRVDRIGVAQSRRIDPHGRAGLRQNRRRTLFRRRSHLSVEPLVARHVGRRRLRPDGRNGRGRQQRSRPRNRTVDRPERCADPARPTVDPSFAVDRPGRHLRRRRHLLRDDGQIHLYGRIADPLVDRGVGAAAPYLHGLRGIDRDGRARRAADEHHPFVGHLHAEDAAHEQPRPQDARLRDDGRRYGHLHRQDRHADPQPDDRAGADPLRRASDGRFRRDGRRQHDRLSRRFGHGARQPDRRGAADLAANRRSGLRGFAERGPHRRPATLFVRTQIHGDPARKRPFRRSEVVREGGSGDRADNVRAGRPERGDRRPTGRPATSCHAHAGLRLVRDAGAGLRRSDRAGRVAFRCDRSHLRSGARGGSGSRPPLFGCRNRREDRYGRHARHGSPGASGCGTMPQTTTASG